MSPLNFSKVQLLNSSASLWAFISPWWCLMFFFFNALFPCFHVYFTVIMALCMCRKALLSNKSKISSLAFSFQATGLCLWGFGCPGRAIVTTNPMALATAKETEGQEASQHNKAMRLRWPPPVMVTHTHKYTHTEPLFRLLIYSFYFSNTAFFKAHPGIS